MKERNCRGTPAHHVMLLLHLGHLLGVLLVHVLQLGQHPFTALAQSLLIVDELQTDSARLTQKKEQVFPEQLIRFSPGR